MNPPIQLLFAHKPHDEVRPQSANGSKGFWQGPFLTTLLEQLLNSTIVAGIVFITTLGPGSGLDWIPAMKGFGLTFLIELRKYARLGGK